MHLQANLCSGLCTGCKTFKHVLLTLADNYLKISGQIKWNRCFSKILHSAILISKYGNTEMMKHLIFSNIS